MEHNGLFYPKKKKGLCLCARVFGVLNVSLFLLCPNDGGSAGALIRLSGYTVQNCSGCVVTAVVYFQSFPARALPNCCGGHGNKGADSGVLFPGLIRTRNDLGVDGKLDVFPGVSIPLQPTQLAVRVWHTGTLQPPPIRGPGSALVFPRAVPDPLSSSHGAQSSLKEPLFVC